MRENNPRKHPQKVTHLEVEPFPRVVEEAVVHPGVVEEVVVRPCHTENIGFLPEAEGDVNQLNCLFLSLVLEFSGPLCDLRGDLVEMSSGMVLFTFVFLV